MKLDLVLVAFFECFSQPFSDLRSDVDLLDDLFELGDQFWLRYRVLTLSLVFGTAVVEVLAFLHVGRHGATALLARENVSLR
ncbi:MAG: hypothetical protein AAB305_00515 [Candidatus Zixiibacteriota bacterium]